MVIRLQTMRQVKDLSLSVLADQAAYNTAMQLTADLQWNYVTNCRSAAVDCQPLDRFSGNIVAFKTVFYRPHMPFVTSCA